MVPTKFNKEDEAVKEGAGFVAKFFFDLHCPWPFDPFRLASERDTFFVTTFKAINFRRSLREGVLKGESSSTSSSSSTLAEPSEEV